LALALAVLVVVGAVVVVLSPQAANSKVTSTPNISEIEKKLFRAGILHYGVLISSMFEQATKDWIFGRNFIVFCTLHKWT
jgi:uncharacterized protein YjeT (DUF2065 family)